LTKIIHGYFKRIPGRRDVAPYLIAHLKWKDVSGYIEFMIDAGSSATVILDRDAIRLGLLKRVKRMEKAERELIGIGGFAETYIMRNVELTLVDFKDSENTITINLDKIYVALHMKRFRGEEWKRLTQNTKSTR